MPLTSDLTVLVSKLDAKRISQKSHEFNSQVEKIMVASPKWYEVGAEKYRRMRENGETPLPAPVFLAEGEDIEIEGVPCRMFKPSSGGAKGLFYHIHGGGWVLQTHRTQDGYLKWLADEHSLITISVGYRLAPENPYPAPNEDCYKVAEYLVDNAEKDYGVPLQFMGGESAGGHLSTVTAFHLLKVRPNFAFKGLVLNYAVFSVGTLLPSVYNIQPPLVLDPEIMDHFFEAYTPGMTSEQRRNPDINPMYADLGAMKLPPALFTIGSLDLLLDDTLFMSTKWAFAGGEGVLKVYPGAPHGFTSFKGTPNHPETVDDAWNDISVFIKERS